MRILSQDGKIDVNYDLGNLSIASGRCEDVERAGIYFHSCSCPNATRLAEYTSLDKARKAMEILREAYMVHFQYKTMTAEQKALFLNFTDEKEQEKIYGVFCFPSDDEVEV